jgi:5-formyltetrahydrofolate cyclo-ligase
VDVYGNRIGKGGGYGDREISYFLSKKAIKADIPIVSTVHFIQIVGNVPQEHHDQKKIKK